MDSERDFWVAFSAFPGIGPVRFQLLRDYFGSAELAWKASRRDFSRINLGEKLIAEFISFRAHFDFAGYMRALYSRQIHLVIRTDSHYPYYLQNVTDAPIVLYVKGVRGKRKLDLSRPIAVVGTRRVTDYGRRVTTQIVRGLVAAGFTIVSGLAYGVDEIAHRTALDCGGQTIAVLGCGIDIIAPASNAYLYHRICREGYGAVVGEMPLGLVPEKGLFVARNRIISGMSVATVVTEAPEHSGALITAKYAIGQGREVFAVPGPVTSRNSRGSATLIKNGAQLVENATDIINALA